MKNILFFLLLGAGLCANGQTKTPPTLRSILLEQFQTTYNKQDWFVPVMQSLEGLTAKQAMWKPSDSSHCIGQLAYHLLFWNRRSLQGFSGKKPAAFSGDNNETFTAFNEESWAATVKELGEVLKGIETFIREADEAKLQSSASEIDHICVHNAYHTGQILYARKLAGNWDAAKGVK